MVDLVCMIIGNDDNGTDGGDDDDGAAVSFFVCDNDGWDEVGVTLGNSTQSVIVVNSSDSSMRGMRE